MTAKGIAFRLFLSLVMALGAALTGVRPVQGAICIWTGATSNSFDNPLNWNGCNGHAPGASDVAVIGHVTTADPVVNSTTTVYQADLNSGGTLVTTGGTFYPPDNRFELPFLIAAGGVSGAFETSGTSDFEDYVAWTLVYRPTEVIFRLMTSVFIPLVNR